MISALRIVLLGIVLAMTGAAHAADPGEILSNVIVVRPLPYPPCGPAALQDCQPLGSERFWMHNLQ
jgi:hypothetical protein